MFRITKPLCALVFTAMFALPATNTRAGTYSYDADITNFGIDYQVVFNHHFDLPQVTSIDRVSIELAHSWAGDISFYLTNDTTGDQWRIVTENIYSKQKALGDGGSSLLGTATFSFVPYGASGGSVSNWGDEGTGYYEYNSESWVVTDTYAAGNWTLTLVDQYSYNEGAVGQVNVHYNTGTGVISGAIGLTPISSSASSSIGGEHTSDRLHDGTVTKETIGGTSMLNTSYAGIGAGPHVVVYDMGSSVDIDGIYYSQRSTGIDFTSDLVTGIEFWVTDIGPGAASTTLSILDDPSTLLNITNVTDVNLTEYDLGTTLSGRYFVMRLTGTGTGNIGGTELQFRASTTSAIPTPGALPAGLTLLGLAATRRRRR